MRALRNINRSLEDYARALTRRLAELPADTPAEVERAIQHTRRVTILARERMIEQLETAVRESRDASFDNVLEVWGRAATEVADVKDVPKHLYGTLRAPSVTLAGAYESLGGAGLTWRTLIRQHAMNAAAEAEFIVTQALTSGAHPRQVSRALRPYVRGAEEFHRAFGELAADGIDLNRLRPNTPALRNAAKEMRFNADRIAFSELHNARAEAELQHFAADPLIAAVAWRLSPFRGPTARTDECDGYATVDWYGMGPGVFPLGKVPLPPHPFDKCERVPVTRSVRFASRPKPNPARARGATDFRAKGLTTAAAERTRTKIARGFAEVETARAPRLVRDLVAQQEAAGRS